MNMHNGAIQVNKQLTINNYIYVKYSASLSFLVMRSFGDVVEAMFSSFLTKGIILNSTLAVVPVGTSHGKIRHCKFNFPLFHVSCCSDIYSSSIMTGTRSGSILALFPELYKKFNAVFNAQLGVYII